MRKFWSKSAELFAVQFHKGWVGGTIGTLACLLLGNLLLTIHPLGSDPLGKFLIDKSYDIPFIIRKVQKPEGAVIVYLDQESLRTLNQGYGRVSRALHAKLIDRLKAEGANVIVFDVFFDDPGDPGETAALAAAMKAHGKVVIASSYERIPADPSIGFPGGWGVAQPRVEEIVRSAAAIGLSQLNNDMSDSEVRAQFPAVKNGTNYFPTLAWRAAELAGSEFAADPRNSADSRLYVNYYGPPMTIPSISYARAVENQASPGFFRGKTVFMGQGVTTGDRGDKKDEFPSPFSVVANSFIPGVEVHATIYHNLMRKDWLTRLHWALETLLILGGGSLFGYGLSRFRPIAAGVLAALGMILTIALAMFLFTSMRIWFAWLILFVQIPVAFVWSLMFHYAEKYVQNRVLEQSLSMYVSEARAHQLIKNPELLKPGAEQQEVSLLFSDIAKYSSITERMLPADLVVLLNDYFEVALKSIHDTDGTVMQLIGDAIFAIWNAPVPQKDHHERAIRAAILLHERLLDFDSANQKLPLHTRIGLHTGLANVGNFGSKKRFNYTAIGDCTNLASRLEGLNKYLGTYILASRDILSKVETKFATCPMGHFKVKGFGRPVEVHEVLGNPEKAGEHKAFVETFSAGLHRFQRKEFIQAKPDFERAENLRKKPNPATFYLAKLKEMETEPPHEEWAGEIDLKDK